MWTRQILPLVESHGVRCIAPDRRGFGRSEWSGPNSSKGEITYETFAADTAALLRSVEGLIGFIFVCSSMGAGESLLVHELLTADDTKEAPRCKGFIWLAPSLPFPLATAENPTAPSRELWDAILKGLRMDREGFVKASVGGVFGTEAGVQMSEDDLQFFIDLIRQNDVVAIERCVQIFSRYDFSRELKVLGEKAGEDLSVVVVAGKDDNSKSSFGSVSALADVHQTGHQKLGLRRSRISSLQQSIKSGTARRMACTGRMLSVSMS